MDRSPFRTLMTKNFPSAPPSLQLLEGLFILRCEELELNPAQVELRMPAVQEEPEFSESHFSGRQVVFRS